MRETTVDFLEGDAYQTAWEANRDEAKREMYAKADKIVIEVQHLVVDDEVEIQNVPKVAKAIEQIKEFSWYSYNGQRWDSSENEYDDDFDYDFEEEVKGILLDEFGYEDS